MQSEILNRMHDRIVQNFLDVAILLELRKRSLSRHDVMDFAQKRFQILLTSGTVSTHLSALEMDGLVKGEDSQGKRVYVLTERGKETITQLLSMKDKILGLFLNLFFSE